MDSKMNNRSKFQNLFADYLSAFLLTIEDPSKTNVLAKSYAFNMMMEYVAELELKVEYFKSICIKESTEHIWQQQAIRKGDKIVVEKVCARCGAHETGGLTDKQ
jgi:tRNA isopentenyl-2-thiomethyl-A-37 hydroxylase MiaE